MMVRFHETLSDQSVYFRYFRAMNLSQRTAHERLTRICFNDYDRELALVAEHTDPQTREREVAAVVRLIMLRGTHDAECAVLVADRFHRLGLGAELLRRLIGVARDENVCRITADILPENHAMQRICEKLGFRLRYETEDRLMKAALVL